MVDSATWERILKMLENSDKPRKTAPKRRRRAHNGLYIRSR